MHELPSVEIQSPSARDISRRLNQTMRRELPSFEKFVARPAFSDKDKQKKPLWAPTRLWLRVRTEYPYKFTETDTLYPDIHEAFGKVIIQDRNEGIKEIHEAISREERERSWLFIPDESLWITNNLGPSVDYYSINEDRGLTVFLSHLYPTIEMVHTHPDKVVRQGYENSFGFTQNYLAEAVKPSSGDLMGHVQLVKNSKPGTRLVTTVVSHYGSTSAELNERGMHAQYHAYPESSVFDQPVLSDPDEAIRIQFDLMRKHLFIEDGLPTFDYNFQRLK